MASGALRPSGPTGSPRTLPSGGTVEGGASGASICLLRFLTAIQGCGRSSSQGCLVTAFEFDEKNVAEPDNRHGASGGLREGGAGIQGGACAWARARAGRGSILPHCGENQDWARPGLVGVSGDGRLGGQVEPGQACRGAASLASAPSHPLPHTCSWCLPPGEPQPVPPLIR